MKCSNCYADNPAWQAICSACGQPVVPIELCASGHVLPPGVRECPICPSMWPEVAAFVGPPVLRGVLWIEGGQILDPARGEPIPLIELRDGEQPLSLSPHAEPDVVVLGGDESRAAAKVLVRPDGVSLCERPDARAASAGPRAERPAYRTFPQDTPLAIGRARLRFIPLAAPAWIEAPAAQKL
jgi:hypothetical protein